MLQIIEGHLKIITFKSQDSCFPVVGTHLIPNLFLQCFKIPEFQCKRKEAILSRNISLNFSGFYYLLVIKVGQGFIEVNAMTLHQDQSSFTRLCPNPPKTGQDLPCFYLKGYFLVDFINFA